ncbi:MAG: 30S ribosomal protein S18 [Pirellulales bacterium]
MSFGGGSGGGPGSRPAGRKRSKSTVRTKRKDPIFVDGKRPRPMFVDYKDLELLSKLVSRQGKIIGRRKSGCTAASQHAVSAAIKRARFMALLPYVAD